MIYNVLQLLEANAERLPNKMALADEKESVTYAEYMRLSKAIGTFLLKNYKKSDTCQPVAVFIDRNIWSVISFLGIVYSGNFYVPIDGSLPEERINCILDKLHPIAVIDARMTDKPCGIPIMSIVNSAGVDNEMLNSVRDQFIDIDPLYTIFTSGSTGTPKGVVISHRSVLDLVNSFAESFAFPEETVFGNQAPFDFDVSVKDIYNALYCGGTVQIIPKRMFMAPKLLIEYLVNKSVTTVIWAVSALRITAEFKGLDSAEKLPKLENVMFSGEVMPIKALNYWMDYFKETRFVNLYGPTEITCNCSYYTVDRRFEIGEVLPIGKPFRNTRIILRDETNGIIKEPNKIGEICVIGTCVSLGYWDDARTGQSFLQTANVSEYNERMYCTGDLGYYDENGNMFFTSRKDFQIKHMGHRIELGEIEVSLNALDCVKAGVCVYSKEKEKIICFYTSNSKEECKKEIAVGLGRKLPKYMLPNVYVHMSDLPLNKNGKIDRKSLEKEWISNNG